MNLIQAIILTNINKSPWRALTELLALVGKRHLHDAWYVTRRGLHSYRMRCY